MCWSAAVEPHCPKSKTGRPLFAIETMLRIHYLQQWFGLSDPVMEEALHDTPVYREIAELDGVLDPLPDESMTLRFRHLLEKRDMATDMLRIFISAKIVDAKTGGEPTRGQRICEISLRLQPACCLVLAYSGLHLTDANKAGMTNLQARWSFAKRTGSQSPYHLMRNLTIKAQRCAF